MKIKELTKIILIKSNPYWPFSFLNKIPYRLALAAFAGFCGTFPEIKNVYLKHSFAEKNLVPGISDIDLTIIISSDLNKAEEFLFLDIFWNRYSGLRKIFPVLEPKIEILSEKDLGDFMHLGIKSYELQSWVKVYGKGFLEKKFKPDIILADRIYQAFFIYFASLTEKFFSDSSPEGLFVEEFKRVSEKVIRYINCRDYAGKTRKKYPSISASFCSIIRALEAIDTNILKFNPDKFDKFGILIKRRGLKEGAQEECAKNISLLINELMNKNKQNIEAVMHSGNKPFIILRDDLDDSALIASLKDIRAIFLRLSRHICYPDIVTKKMFKGPAKLYDPLWPYYWADKNDILYGKEIIGQIEPPDKYLLINHALKEARRFPAQLREIRKENRPYRDWLSTPEMDRFLRVVIKIKLFLEKGIIITTKEALLEEWKRHYNDIYTAAKELKGKGNLYNRADLPLKKFSLLKMVIEDLGKTADRYSDRLAA